MAGSRGHPLGSGQFGTQLPCTRTSICTRAGHTAGHSWTQLSAWAQRSPLPRLGRRRGWRGLLPFPGPAVSKAGRGPSSEEVLRVCWGHRPTSPLPELDHSLSTDRKPGPPEPVGSHEQSGPNCLRTVSLGGKPPIQLSGLGVRKGNLTHKLHGESWVRWQGRAGWLPAPSLEAGGGPQPGLGRKLPGNRSSYSCSSLLPSWALISHELLEGRQLTRQWRLHLLACSLSGTLSPTLQSLCPGKDCWVMGRKPQLRGQHFWAARKGEEGVGKPASDKYAYGFAGENGWVECRDGWALEKPKSCFHPFGSAWGGGCGGRGRPG